MSAQISVYELLLDSAQTHASRPAFRQASGDVTYAALLHDVQCTARKLVHSGIQPGERIAVYAGKHYDTVVMFLAINAMGAVLVPINPQLKAPQVRHILLDSGACLFVSTGSRLKRHAAVYQDLPITPWALEEKALQALDSPPSSAPFSRTTTATDNDPAVILYTSGSTGRPKGVVLSERNLVAGAHSVADYLSLQCDDVILGVLPLSFDAGLSQLTTALACGACYVPLDFLQASEVPRCCQAHGVTTITGVPPLWVQLASVPWPSQTAARIRRFANTGGHMPAPLLARLQQTFPEAQPFLMYGLTEAFRSTYLPPSAVATHPDSIGKAVPNAAIHVVRADGTECDPGEHGELVHRGAFVTLGYWNAPELTAQRFRPWPGANPQVSRTEIAVWSGDIVYRDQDDYLYFVARQDDLIKTSGYRVSPTEIEEVLFAVDQVIEAAAYGVAHPQHGQAIVISVVTAPDQPITAQALIGLCREQLPTYMVPLHVSFHDTPLPRNPNGKIDRQQLKQRFSAFFSAAPTATE
ncbi:acyl-CoA ligase (AMP-forming), exosortase A system-associated [Pseudomonas chlororaphis]|uniref:acyl-CoA ligase (AMP-forming), exosortase A system-associated n=1 Tax=Pseudomonas chlororaphis TaxID=587753 RepID=UPI0015DDF7E4|nr:acyl-CoA ligase (AMP-forming), exosortase A system-associated [Pseudomonas chlororaphis]QLL12562.1 acyl-CoA ligase (AMP-forming), exosortase A system-associated [Pseudomonas chlororaphis subsp. aurantiaca]